MDSLFCFYTIFYLSEIILYTVIFLYKNRCKKLPFLLHKLLSKLILNAIMNLAFLLVVCMTTTPKVEVVKQLPFLTERQMSLLHFLHSYLQDHRYMPTRREIASFLELKSDNATPYLNALEKKGYLTRSGERLRRNLELTQAAYEKLELESFNLIELKR